MVFADMTPKKAKAIARELAIRNAAEELFLLIKQWAALDGGRWHPERHSVDKRDLLAETKKIIARLDS